MNKEKGTLIELYPGLPSHCLIYSFSVIITEFRNKRLKRLKNSKYISVDKKTGLKIWHTPRLNLTIYQNARNRQGYYLHVFYSHMKATGMLFFCVGNCRFWSHYKESVTASTDNTLQYLHNSSYDTKAEFNNLMFYYSLMFYHSFNVLLFIQNNS